MSAPTARDRALALRPGLLLARAAGTYALARRVPSARTVRSRVACGAQAPRGAPLLFPQPARAWWRGAREQTRKFRRNLRASNPTGSRARRQATTGDRSEEHTSELQSQSNLVC